LRPIPNETVSRLIGSIYDCAIDPQRWPQTMGEISEVGRFLGCVLLVLDPATQSGRFHMAWGVDPMDQRQFEADYSDDPVVSVLYTLGDPRHDPDGPVVFERFVDAATRARSRLHQDWSSRLGIVDSIATVALRAPNRLGFLSAVRHASVGVITDREVALMRLLAPHVRRAVTISDLLDMRTLEAGTLAATLDMFALGVILIGEDARILHANEAARNMFEAGTAVTSRDGVLTVRAQAFTDQIAAATAPQARRAPATRTPVGVPLLDAKQRAGQPPAAMAYVLPLVTAGLEARLMPQALAAVFITTVEADPDLMLAAATATYGLTAAETRLLGPIRQGLSVPQTAQALCVSENTIKTQLARIYAKTGVSRQAELVALLANLAPPVR
jgi:DNA-binding CsgD family transcriptional regulator